MVGTRKGAFFFHGDPARRTSRNAGKSWERQAFADDGGEPLGLYLRTTSGEIWMSTDEGKRWRCLARHLPEIYTVQAASL